MGVRWLHESGAFRDDVCTECLRQQLENLKVIILLLISNGHLFWEWRGNHRHEKLGSESTGASNNDEFEEVESVLRLKLSRFL